MKIIDPSTLQRHWLNLMGLGELHMFEVDDAQVAEQVADIKAHHQHENMGEEDILCRAIARVASIKYQVVDRAKLENDRNITVNYFFTAKEKLGMYGWMGIVLLLLIFMSSKAAHCQPSGTTNGPRPGLTGLIVANGGVTQKTFTSGYPNLNFTGSGIGSVVCSGTVCTVTITGGSGSGSPGGLNTNIQYNNGGAFGGIGNGTLGQILTSQGAGSAPAFADPLVQGTQADLSTTIVNPVAGGGYDLAGSPALHKFVMLSSSPAGTEFGLIVRNIPSGTQTVSGTITTTPPSNASTNIAQYGGSNVGAANAFHVQPGTAATWDISDRAARLVGVVYGSQAQQLKQTATNFNLQSELAVGGTLIDPRSVRALTSADVVTANQGTANTLANAWGMKLTDGTNTMPTMDTVGRSGFHRITDGTNTMAVKAASTAAAAADPAGVVSLSPNSPVPAGANLIGEIVQVATAVTTDSALENFLTSAATTNATSVKASAGNLYGYECINTTTTAYYLRLYNLAAAPTCSSATGFVKTIPCGGAAAAGQTGGILRDYNAPVGYTTGIAYCLTGGGSSTDNTAAATGVYVTVKYK